MTEKNEWECSDGKVMKITEMTHQHLSNCIHKFRTDEPRRAETALKEIIRRFGGKVLPSTKGKPMIKHKGAPKRRAPYSKPIVTLKSAGIDEKILSVPYYHAAVTQKHEMLTRADFFRACAENKLKDEDGMAFAAKDEMYNFTDSIKPSMRILLPDDATHIVWMAR